MALEWTTIIVAFIAAIPGLIALIVQRRRIRAETKAADADATEKITGAAERVVTMLERRIDELEKTGAENGRRIKDLEEDVKVLSAHVKVLEQQIIELGAIPIALKRTWGRIVNGEEPTADDLD